MPTAMEQSAIASRPLMPFFFSSSIRGIHYADILQSLIYQAFFRVHIEKKYAPFLCSK